VVVEGVVGCVFVSGNRSAEKYSLRGKEVSNWLLEHGSGKKLQKVSMRKYLAASTYKNFIAFWICIVLIKGKHNKCVVHEVRILQQRLKEGPRPGRGEGDGCIMAIVCHIWGHE
jgi:hypothetical protein